MPAMLTAIEKISVQDIFRSDSNVVRRGLMFFFFLCFSPSAILHKFKNFSLLILFFFFFFFLIQNVTR